MIIKSIEMKRLLLFVFAVYSCIQLRASHYAGGEVTYTYIGDSTGINGHYRIDMLLFRDNSWNAVNFSTTENVDIESCNGLDTVIKLSLMPGSGNVYTKAEECWWGNYGLEVYHYRGYFVFPFQGICGFKIVHDGCCRMNGIINLYTPNSWQYLVTQSDTALNNAPTSGYPGPRVFCTNYLHYWPHHFYDIDGDSIYVELTEVLGYNGDPISWSPGFSINYPLSHNNQFGFNLNNQMGSVTFEPTAIERSVLAYKLKEFRYSASQNIWYEVGSRYYEKIAYLESSCPVGYKPESLFIDSSVNQYSCYTKTVGLKINQAFITESLDTSGTDFIVINPIGHLEPIKSIQPVVGEYIGESDSLNIVFHNSLNINGIYKVVSLIGSDGNTLFNHCGGELKVLDTTYFKVSGCSSFGISENNLDVFVWPNPTRDQVKISFNPENTLESIKIYSANGQLLADTFVRDNRSYFELDISFVRPGVYYAIIQFAEGVSTQKIIKQ